MSHPHYMYGPGAGGYGSSVAPYDSNAYPDGSQPLEHVPAPSSGVRRRVMQIIFDLIGIFIVFLTYGLVNRYSKARVRYYTCDQSDVSYPLLRDSVPIWGVGIYGAIGPALFILFVELWRARMCGNRSRYSTLSTRSRCRRFWVNLFHALSLFIFGIGTTLLLTEIGKKWIGRLRPHFLAVCAPNIGTIDCITPALTGFVYKAQSTGGIFCTGNENDIEDARLSFPSGHASYACYTMLFLIIYLEARLFLIRTRYIKTIIQITAFIAAYVTSISRIVDYQHRGSDVIGGAILGIVVALFFSLVLGRVLWEYGGEQQYYDFEARDAAKQAARGMAV